MITTYNAMLNGKNRSMVEKFFILHYFYREWEAECESRDEMADEDVKETYHQLTQQRFEEINNLPPSEFFENNDGPPLEDPDFFFYVPH